MSAVGSPNGESLELLRQRAFKAMGIHDQLPPIVLKVGQPGSGWAVFSPAGSWNKFTSLFAVCRCQHPVCQSVTKWNEWAVKTNYSGPMPELVEWKL